MARNTTTTTGPAFRDRKRTLSSMIAFAVVTACGHAARSTTPKHAKLLSTHPQTQPTGHRRPGAAAR